MHAGAKMDFSVNITSSQLFYLFIYLLLSSWKDLLHTWMTTVTNEFLVAVHNDCVTSIKNLL